MATGCHAPTIVSSHSSFTGNKFIEEAATTVAKLHACKRTKTIATQKGRKQTPNTPTSRRPPQENINVSPLFFVHVNAAPFIEMGFDFNQSSHFHRAKAESAKHRPTCLNTFNKIVAF